MIRAGEISVGDKLPSTAALTVRFGVSRTVVREAIASLQADGLLVARQGSGVFVRSAPPRPLLPLPAADPFRISSVIEMLEVRTALEVEAARLAAARRSPAQAEKIVEAWRAIDALIALGEPTLQADFAFHCAVADATNNPRFSEFLSLLGPNLIPRRVFDAPAASASGSAGQEGVSGDYLRAIQAEHGAIAAGIARGDEDGASDAMRVHLRGSQERYRALLGRAR